jgi:group I intron endonuclease
MSYGIIYKITNTVNDKIYIGQTITSLKSRWQSHVSSAKCNKPWVICSAIRKYGEENFKIEQIDIAHSKVELDDLEVKYIKDLTPHYNMCAGGGGLGSPSNEVRKKISDKLKGRIFTKERSEKQSIRQLGRVLSDETKLKIKNAQIGRTYPDRQSGMSKSERKIKRDEKYIFSLPEDLREIMQGLTKNEKIAYRAKLNSSVISERMRGDKNPMYGKLRSDEDKQKLSELSKGVNNPYYGKKHSEEVLAKMRLAHANRPLVECPHCKKTGILSNMKRWHLDNCKVKQ